MSFHVFFIVVMAFMFSLRGLRKSVFNCAQMTDLGILM
jgi:hypothetical protein